MLFLEMLYALHYAIASKPHTSMILPNHPCATEQEQIPEPERMGVSGHKKPYPREAELLVNKDTSRLPSRHGMSLSMLITGAFRPSSRCRTSRRMPTPAPYTCAYQRPKCNTISHLFTSGSYFPQTHSRRNTENRRVGYTLRGLNLSRLPHPCAGEWPDILEFRMVSLDLTGATPRAYILFASHHTFFTGGNNG